MDLTFARSRNPAARRAKRKEKGEIARDRARAKHQADVSNAQRDAAKFIELALRNEQDDSRLRNAEFHEEWQRHFDQHRLAVLIAPVEHAKTQQVAVGRTLHTLGNDPNERIAIISNTEKQASKVLRQVRQEIERNHRMREVFPDLRRSPHASDVWTQSAITVARDTRAKDASLQCLGVYGPINGSRINRIILDDVLNFENTRTSEQRKKLIEWFDTEVFTRLLPGGSIWAIGTPWHTEDLLHDLEKRPGFRTKRYSAVKNPDEPVSRWKTIWPETWDVARLNERRENMADGVFARKYLCRVRMDDTARFRQVWLERMVRLGKGRTLLAEPPRTHVRGPQLPCYTGVDFGVGDKEDDALTVLFTIALLPNGQRLIVDIESGRWQAPEIIDRLRLCYRRYNSEIFVESNGAQKWISQLANIPVTAFHTGKNKWSEEWGVESLAVEMRNNQWIMPSGSSGENVHPEGKAFIHGCLHYDRRTHTSDHLMAAWLARECSRKFGKPRTRHMDTLAR